MSGKQSTVSKLLSSSLGCKIPEIENILIDYLLPERCTDIHNELVDSIKNYWKKKVHKINLECFLIEIKIYKIKRYMTMLENRCKALYHLNDCDSTVNEETLQRKIKILETFHDMDMKTKMLTIIFTNIIKRMKYLETILDMANYYEGIYEERESINYEQIETMTEDQLEKTLLANYDTMTK